MLIRADNVLSKINTDYDSGLCAALASLIIHIYFSNCIIGRYGWPDYFVHRHYIRSDESCSLIGQRLPGIASIAAREDLTRHKETRDKMLGPERIDKE